MPVLVTAEVPGQTAEGYDATLRALRPLLTGAPGFLFHAAYASPEGWRVIEVWQSAKDATDFFARFVRPQLPPDVRPRRRLQELHSWVTA